MPLEVGTQQDRTDAAEKQSQSIWNFVVI